MYQRRSGKWACKIISAVHFHGASAVAHSWPFHKNAGFVGQLDRSISQVMQIMKAPMIARLVMTLNSTSETNQPRQNNIPRSNKQKRVGWPRGSSDVKVSHPLIAACCAIPQDQDSKSKADGSTKTKSYKSVYYRYVAVYLQNMTYLPVQPYETAGTDYTSLLVIPFPCSCQNWLQIERKLQNPQYHMTAFVAQQKAGTSDLQAVPEPVTTTCVPPDSWWTIDNNCCLGSRNR